MGRELLAKGAAKTAELVAPPEEKLREVDQSAPNDQFITEGGRVAGPNETPILEVKIPGTDKTFKSHPREGQSPIKKADGNERPVGEYRDKVQEKYTEVKGEVTSRAGEAQGEGKAHAKDVMDADQPSRAADEKKQGMLDKMKQLRVSLLSPL